MPNWTSNNVLFVGKESQLKKLQTMLKSDDNEFDFNNLHFFTKYGLILFMIVGRIELLTILLLIKNFLFKS